MRGWIRVGREFEGLQSPFGLRPLSETESLGDRVEEIEHALLDIVLSGCLPRTDGEQLVGQLALLGSGEGFLPVLISELFELALVEEA